MESQKLKVTFFNALSGRRGLVCDDLTADEAAAVKAKLSNPKQPFFYLSEVRVERDAPVAA